MTRVPIALTIAGSDPSGGAGLQADLKTFHAFDVYGASVVTLLTVQNTCSVDAVELVSPALVVAQARAVLDDLDVAAIKTGALGGAAIIEAVATVLASVAVPVVVDPVMISKHGAPLLALDARDALVERLLPRATLLTPNGPEAAALAGFPVTDVASARRACARIAEMGPTAVLVKGGHLDGAESVDVLFHEDVFTEFRAPRVVTRAGHGTGCTLSAAITANLALGHTLPASVERAKAFLTEALRRAPAIGRGIGPVEHRLRPA